MSDFLENAFKSTTKSASIASCVRPGVVEGVSGSQKLSRGFLRLVALLPTLPPPGPLYPGLPQSSLSSSTPYSFPYANVPTLHQRRVNLCKEYFNRLNDKEHKLHHLLPLYMCRQVPYSLGRRGPTRGPHQCCLRLGHSGILILSCHGVYGIVTVTSCFFSSQCSSLLCVTALLLLCACV